MRDFKCSLKNIFQEESNGQLRMTKRSKIVLEIVFYSVNRGDKSYLLPIQTVLGGVGIKTR